MYFSQFWRLVSTRPRCQWILFLVRVSDGLLLMFSYGLTLVCAIERRERPCNSSFFGGKGINPIMRTPRSLPNVSLQTWSQLGVTAVTHDLGDREHKHLVSSRWSRQKSWIMKERHLRIFNDKVNVGWLWLVWTWPFLHFPDQGPSTGFSLMRESYACVELGHVFTLIPILP